MRQLKISHKITNRDSKALEKYLSDISKIDMISPKEEVKLAQEIKKGSDEALMKMVNSNLRFVVSVAKQYQGQGLSLIDLINEGNVGLMKAAKRFDETRGFKFISYAVWWIRQSILQSITENARMVRLPLNKVNMYKKLKEAQLEYLQKHEREPSTTDLAEMMEITVKEVEEIIQNSTRHMSLDSPVNNEGDDTTMIDFFPSDHSTDPDNSVMEESLKKDILKGLSILSRREIDIIKYFFGLDGEKPQSLEEIAKFYDLTRERVRQIKDRAIHRLRKSVRKSELKSYIG